MRRIFPLLSLLALLCWAPAAAASAGQTVTFEAPRELLSASTRAATLDQIEAFGVKRIRQIVYWRDYASDPDSRVKPSEPYHRWANLDGLVAAARERGIAVTLTLTGPAPRWAAGPDGVTNPDARQFGAFAAAAGRRYGEAVDTWSIWNEPNQPQFLMPQYRDGKPYSPKLYRRLYRAAHAALRSTPANASDTILIGETSPRGNGNVVHPLAFLRGLLCLDSEWRRNRSCGALEADGYAHHAYTTTAGPRWVPPHSDDVTIGVLSRLERALDRAARAGALPHRLPIHLTEFGIQTEPDRISGVSLARQAAYLAQAEHLAYVNPRVATFSQYLMSDDPPRLSGYRYGGFESGLRSADGRAKPAYAGFRLPLSVEVYDSEAVVWGLVRPLQGQTTVTVERRPLGGERWHLVKTLQTTSRGVYALRSAHRAGQRYRVRWTAPDGRTYIGAAVRGV